MMVIKKLLSVLFLVSFAVGCAGIPVREEVKVDPSLPIGKIEGNQFTGIRYPFNVSAPPGWKITTEIPNFMESLGYEKAGLEESQVFIYNPSTQSNVQIDLTPAGRYAKFDQGSIEWLTTAAVASFKEEMEKDHGKEMDSEIMPTNPLSLKGVPYAAKKYATYILKGSKREQGWVYGFSEPYQIFILYMILEKEEAKDRKDIKTILDSFEFISKK